MITITSYLHDEVFSDVIRRWMNDDLRASDADLITRLVNFNTVYVSRYLRDLSAKLFRELFHSEIRQRAANWKRDIKDVLVDFPHYTNPHIDELIQNYHAQPGRYYRETPYHGTLYFSLMGGVAKYVGSCRIKRIRRLAEKSARKIIDGIYDAIRARADALAEERARRLGVSKDDLMTPPEEMAEEFLKAESRILEDIRQRRIFNMGDIVISDVAGIKVILEDPDQERLLSFFRTSRDCDIIEEEKQSGKYNATNLIVRYRPPREELLDESLSEEVLAVMRTKGMNQEKALNTFVEFVRTGRETVQLEIIVSNYQDTLESEIGRCIHEDRIIEQRRRQQYRSFLAKNIEYLMEFLFTFPASSRIEIDELPIKLWNRYLADYFDSVLKDLFRIPTVDILD